LCRLDDVIRCRDHSFHEMPRNANGC
jgi:hypothetical protein